MPPVALHSIAHATARSLNRVGWAAACLAASSLFAAGAWAAPDAPAQTQSAAQTASSRPAVPLDDLFRFPRLANLKLSPSGRYLAATSQLNGRMNLTVMDLDTRKATGITSFSDLDVVDLNWVEDERLVFSVGQYGQPNMTQDYIGGGLFVVNRDGSRYRRLAPSLQQAMAEQLRWRRLNFFRTVPGSTSEIIAIGNQSTQDANDLYRVNLDTGRTTLMTGGRPAFQAESYLLDEQLVPRVVMGGIKNTLTSVVYYRDGEASAWREIARYDHGSGTPFIPLAVDKGGKTLQVATAKGRDTLAVYRYAPATQTLGDRLAAHPRFDMGADASGSPVAGMVIDPETDELLGYRANADQPEVVWLNDAYRRTQAMVDAALPNRVNLFRRTRSHLILVTSYSDTVPLQWFLLDEAKKTMEELASAKPQLEGKLVKQIPMRFKTRDGLEMTGYYFVPPGYKAGDPPLPTIVHIHGGPFARADAWGQGFGVLEGQLFASRGYAVVVPNFRITPGMGIKNYQAGYGSFGREMIDDHEDAVRWAVEKGLTDPRRVCISGASYGGYAALMAPIRSPGTYQCAVSGLAPTDMKYQLNTMDGDTALSIAGQQAWMNTIGAKSLDDPLLDRVSPLRSADQLKIPVLLYAGRADIRVPFAQIDQMASALTRAGNAPKAFIVKSEEGHGFAKPANNVELYTRILDFVQSSIGPGRP